MSNLQTPMTLTTCAAFLQELDPNTAVTLTALRRLVRTKRIPFAKVGTRYIVTPQNVLGYYTAQTQPTPAQPEQDGDGIRPLPERHRYQTVNG